MSSQFLVNMVTWRGQMTKKRAERIVKKIHDLIDCVDDQNSFVRCGPFGVRDAVSPYDEAKTVLRSNADELKDALTGIHAEAFIIFINGVYVLLTGGMSGGDDPSGLYSALSNLYEAGVVPVDHIPDSDEYFLPE